jgi:predicted MPP superfamily phosphohydrolase
MSFNHRYGPSLPKRLILFVVRILLHNPVGMALSNGTRLFYRQGGPGWVDVSRIRLPLPRLSTAFHGYKIAQLSDFHIGTWLSPAHLTQAVELANQERPDLIVITGDFVTYHPDHHYDDLVRILSQLQAQDGVVAVLGNHDHWSDPAAVRQIIALAGIRDLSNNLHTLVRDSDQLHICGVDDYMNAMDRLGDVLQRLPEEGTAILLSHAPDFADVSAATGRFDLQLSGHSHGGQVVLPLIGSPILPGYARKYRSGLYHVNGMLQYTNRGLGTAEFQVRWNCRPEISILTLESVKTLTG